MPPRDPIYDIETKAARDTEIARLVRATRLAALRAIGWANLTAAQRDEATALIFDLGR